jgi:hypothetical protein
VDDNFAINVKRTKALLRDIIAAGAQLSWVGQISANLLRDEELLDLIAASGGKWIFIGMESLDPANLASVNKSFNKPANTRRAGTAGAQTQRLRHHVVHLRPGQRHARSGRAHPGRRCANGRRCCPSSDRSLPFPATPLYDRLAKEGRLTRPQALAGIRAVPHGAHAVEDDGCRGAGRSQLRVDQLLQSGGHPRAIESIADEPVPYKISHLMAASSSAGSTFPPKGMWGWLKLIGRTGARSTAS